MTGTLNDKNRKRWSGKKAVGRMSATPDGRSSESPIGLSNDPIAVVTIDSSGAIETFDAGAEEMFGYSADEAIGQNVNMLMGSPYHDEHDSYLRRYRETGEYHVIGRAREFRARRNDGSEFPIQLFVSEIDRRGIFRGVIRDVTEQRAVQDEISRIRALEQDRVGQELHDNVQQYLTGLGLLAKTLSETLRECGDASACAAATKIADGIAETNRHVRALAKGLVPIPVSADGLIEALYELAKSTENANGISCRFDCPTPVHVPDDSVALHIYRMAQEAVTNAVKHAQASTISIHLGYSNHALELEVLDDGVGIGQSDRRNGGLGLRIMEHRCGLIGGVLSVQRRNTGGTAVSCRISKGLAR
jgi:PAS domain S-box-containing protein